MTETPFFSHMLDPEIDRIFTKLCADAEPTLLLNLVKDVDRHVAQAREALAVNEFLDVVMAEQVASLLVGLINKIGKYPQEKQKLIVGAARYFVRSHDVQDDMRSLLGFDDDVAVVNYVLTELGYHDMRIKL